MIIYCKTSKPSLISFKFTYLLQNNIKSEVFTCENSILFIKLKFCAKSDNRGHEQFTSIKNSVKKSLRNDDPVKIQRVQVSSRNFLGAVRFIKIGYKKDLNEKILFAQFFESRNWRKMCVFYLISATVTDI